MNYNGFLKNIIHIKSLNNDYSTINYIYENFSDKIEVDKLPTECNKCLFYKWYNNSFSYCSANCEDNSYEEASKNETYFNLSCRRSDCKLVEKDKIESTDKLNDIDNYLKGENNNEKIK